ncbi:MAG TPA: S53 family peptidase [Acidimicrobiales bacterium]|nr:S53 family peptidase [Acidimicrobiales bacterium]
MSRQRSRPPEEVVLRLVPRLRRSVGAALAAGTLATAGTLAAGAAPVPAGAASAGAATTVLTGDVLSGLSGLPSSPTPGSTPVQVGVTIASPDRSGLDASYRAIYTPGSAQYHRFLSAGDVAAQFGVPAATESAVEAWATRAGLRKVFVSTDNEYLLLAGTAGQAESTFSVTLANFTAPDGSTFYANTTGPTIPAGLGVDGVLGLNSYLKAHTYNHAPSADAPHGTPAQDTCLSGTCIGLTTPQDLWSIYDQPTAYSDPNADFGQGQQMGVLGEGAVAGPLKDLRAFEGEFGLAQIPVTVHSVNDDFQDTSGAGEWDIDTQASTGMAPKAYGETLYFAKDLTDSSVLADFQAWSGDANGPLQANASFGECEEDPTSAVLEPTDNNAPTAGVLAGPAGVEFTSASETALEEATLQGKTLFSSTGDTGSSCPAVAVDVNGVGNELFPETSYPASSRYVVAVGGTVLYGTPNTATPPASNSQRSMETAWTFTGGGNSFYIPEPAYQKGISLLDQQDCLAQPDGTPYSSPTPCRGVPDVAAQSGDVISNGYATTMGGAPDQAGGGTSLSSPLWMGMWARVQAAAPATGTSSAGTPVFGGLGFANETLYKLGKGGSDAQDFFDIGSGPPQSPITGNGYYTSLPRSPLDPTGWDYVSGLGAPHVTHLAVDATGNATLTPPDNVTAPAAQDCGQPGLPPCSSGGGGGTCPAGGPLWTNPPHTATDILGNSDPQLSLLAGNLAVSGSNLVATLTVANLSTQVPSGATGMAWYSTWTLNGTTYFAQAEVGPTGVPDFADGTVSGNQYSAVNSDTGTLTPGPNGTVQIVVPLANVGNPPTGSILSAPAGKTYTEEGTPPTSVLGSNGLLEQVDSGGPGCSFTT